MYQLTVEDGDDIAVTDHPDRDAAHGQLMRHVVRGDYYLRTVHTGPAHSTYELLALTDDRRRPHSAGHAVIEEHADERALPVDPPERAAGARLISHQEPSWEHGSDTVTDAGYPLAILTAARAEARCWFAGDTLLPEAARLAGAVSIPRPIQQRLDALRQYATTQPTRRAEDLAAGVTGPLEIPAAASTVAALIWWYALLSWGAIAT
jgi:hypothetical protein